MKYISAIFCLFILTACAESNVPPSQNELQTAATKSYAKINEEVAKIANECRGQGGVIVNPLKAMKCTSVCSFDPKDCKKLPTVDITDFKKLACVEAVGQPGWVCDYQYAVSSQSAFLLKMFKNLYGSETVLKGRFFKSDAGEWMMVPYQ